MDDAQPKQPIEEVEDEEVKGVPFGAIGATILTNILQYSLLLGISMVILIIIRIFMPASMVNP